MAEVAVLPQDGLGAAVAGSAPPLRIVNVTPLLLRANGKDLKPFEPVDCAWDPVEGIRVSHPSTGCRIKNIPASACFSISTLTVDAAGQQFSIAVTPTTQIIKPVPANLNDLAPGERVLLRTVRGPAGALRATSINIVGVPPQ